MYIISLCRSKRSKISPKAAITTVVKGVVEVTAHGIFRTRAKHTNIKRFLAHSKLRGGLQVGCTVIRFVTEQTSHESCITTRARHTL